MRFITCTGYHGSGSSALTDLISEFDGVTSCGDEEFRFVFDSDGISDLEYHLVWSFERISSARAIDRFLKRIDYHNGTLFGKRYRKFFGEEWEKRSHEYIDQLSDFTYYGMLDDLIALVKWKLYLRRAVFKLLHCTAWRKEPERELTSKQKLIYFAHPTEERFLRCTREYIEGLFGTIIGNNKFIMADQLVPSSNIERYLRYFDDIKVIVVDRDPRDIFLLAKYYWRDGVVPTNVEEFCKWFVSVREGGKYRRGGIMQEQIRFLWFEDLVYQYDKTTRNLIEWLGLDPAWHTHPKSVFNPEVSIHNTRVWEKGEYNMTEVRYIEEHLKDYMYSI